MNEPTSAIHQILKRLDALEAQVAALSRATPPGGAGWAAAAGTGTADPLHRLRFARPRRGGPAGPAFDDVVQLARSGNKLAAIKLYRDYTGVGLQEAKYFVDNC